MVYLASAWIKNGSMTMIYEYLLLPQADQVFVGLFDDRHAQLQPS